MRYCTVNYVLINKLGIHKPKTYVWVRNLWLTFLFTIKTINFCVWLKSLSVSVGDILYFTHSTFFFLTCYICLVKLFYITKKSKLVYELITYFDEVLLEFEDKFDIPEFLSKEKLEKTVQKFTIGFLASGVVLAGTYCLLPLVLLVVMGPEELGGGHNKNESSKGIISRPVPLKTWWPFDVDVTYIYVLTYLYQSVVVCTLVGYYLNYNSTCYSMMYHIIHRFKILHYMLEHIKETSESRVLAGKLGAIEKRDKKQFSDYLVSQVSVTSGVTNSRMKIMPTRTSTGHVTEERVDHGLPGRGEDFPYQLEQQMKHELRHCIRYHQSLLRFCEELETLMGPVMLSDVLSTLIVLCVSGFQLALDDSNGSKLISIEEMFEFTVMLFVYCWFSSELAHQSSLVSEAMYNSDWTDASDSYKSTILIVMIRSQKPVAFTIGKYGVLTLDTFVAVLRIAYSNYAVLREVNTS